MGRAQAIEPAIAGRNPNRTAGIGAKRQVDQAAGHRRSRAARGAAGDASRRVGVGRRAVVGVLAIEAEGKFIGDRLANQVRARAE